VEKNIVRKRARQILTGLSKEDIDRNSLVVSKNIISLLQNIQKSITSRTLKIGAYCPIQQEVMWFRSFKASDYIYCVPHLIDEHRMEFYRTSLEKVIQGELGLSLKDEDRSELGLPDVLLIPGLAFTASKNRLGRGKGFYDRYLSQFKGIKIGVCFSEQIFDEVPTDEFDQSMNYLVTEKKIYK
jgi:5-formyltetrahydrofolate cyclo-ligase